MQEYAAVANVDAGNWIVDHYNLIVSIILNQNVPREDALDIAQTVCLRLWQKWGTYEDRGADRKRWAITIARNAAMDWHRHRGVFFTKVFGRLIEQEPSVDVEEVATLRCQIAELWAQMNAMDRDMTRSLARGEQMQEQAARQSLPVTTIKARRHDLREHMHRVTQAMS